MVKIDFFSSQKKPTGREVSEITSLKSGGWT